MAIFVHMATQQVALYKIYGTVDFPISKNDKICTASEADGKQFQFCRVPFGITNGVACFQRIIDKFIADNSLSHTFAN